MSGDRGLLRRRHGHEHHKVDFVELFFDLVFVFAVTQVSHFLIEHVSLVGVIETALLTLAVWWVWIYTSWVTNWLDPAKLPVRLALLALMLPGLVLSASLPQAFAGRGLAFAGAYVTMQVGRTSFFLWAVRGHPGMVRNFQRILVWFVASAVFWLSGALLEGGPRLLVWAAALGLEVVAPSLGFRVPGLGRANTAEWDVEGGHLAERCALFVIIALGESLLVTGATFAGMAWTPSVVTALVASFTGSVAMWWLYFDTSAEAGSRTISSSDDPGRIARLVYTYLHLFLVAGVIVSAVADEFVMAHPDGHVDARTIAMVLAGNGLFLVGIGAFTWAIGGRVPRSSVAGLAALMVLAPIAGHLTPVALMASAAAVLMAVAVWEGRDGTIVRER
jgi:low temperature requirement protein LtrA